MTNKHGALANNNDHVNSPKTAKNAMVVCGRGHGFNWILLKCQCKYTLVTCLCECRAALELDLLTDFNQTDQ